MSIAESVQQRLEERGDFIRDDMELLCRVDDDVVPPAIRFLFAFLIGCLLGEEPAMSSMGCSGLKKKKKIKNLVHVQFCI